MEKRIYGFDIIRTLSFFAIYIFHLSITTFNTPEVAASYFSKVAYIMEAYARTFSVSGFTIIFLTCFLMAFSQTPLKLRLRIFGFMFLGWIVFQLLVGSSYQTIISWDVYPLILFSIGICLICRSFSDRLVYALSVIGFIMLFIPFWKFRDLLPAMSLSTQNILGFADCNNLEVDEWPILPWAGICWLAYGIGMKTFEKKSISVDSLRVETTELAVWACLLCVSLAYYGDMYNVSLGYKFSCSMFRFPPTVFWAHFIWPLFFMRIALDPRFQNYLSKLSVPKFLGKLTMNRHFWLSYFINFVTCSALGEFYKYELSLDGANVYWLVPLCYSIGFPLSESLAFLLEKLFARYVRPS